MVDGRAKGNRFENDVCRMLSVWVEGPQYANAKVYTLPFRRRFTSNTPLDGHWEGEGDILHTPDIEFPFAVECKNQEGWELDGLVGAPKWKPWSWWEQAKDQAQRAGKLPLLIFTRKHRQVLGMLEKEVAKCLKIRPLHAPVVAVTRPLKNGLSTSGKRRRLRSKRESVVVALMSDLMEVPRSVLLKLNQR